MAEEKFNFSTTLKDTFKTIKEVFVKPATTDTKRFADAKNAGIFAGCAAVLYLVIELLSSIISTVVTKSCENVSLATLSCTSYKTSVDFDNLNNFKFFEVLGHDILYLVGAVAVIAVVVYVMGLIFKKQPKFMKLVAVVTAGFAPLFAGGFVAGIVSYIWLPLAIFVFFAGLVLSIAYMVNGVSKEIVLEGDKKVFFHVAAIVVIFIVAYFILTNVAKDSAVSSYLKLLNF